MCFCNTVVFNLLRRWGCQALGELLAPSRFFVKILLILDVTDGKESGDEGFPGLVPKSI